MRKSAKDSQLQRAVADIIENNKDAFASFLSKTNSKPSPRELESFLKNSLAIPDRQADQVKLALDQIIKERTKSKNIRLVRPGSETKPWPPRGLAGAITRKQVEAYLQKKYEGQAPRPSKLIGDFGKSQKELQDRELRIAEILRRRSGGKEFAQYLASWYDILLKDRNYSHDELGKTTILEEVTKQRLEIENSLVDQFQAAQAKLGFSSEGAHAFFERVRTKALAGVTASPARPTAPAKTEPTESIPTKAPELYRDRQKRQIDGVHRKESAEEFTRRVYQKWLGKGLLRSDVKSLDKGLIEALYKQGFPIDFNILLPTSQGRRSDTENRSDSERLAARLESQRRYDHKRGRTKTI